jgi:hypothetical protein
MASGSRSAASVRPAGSGERERVAFEQAVARGRYSEPWLTKALGYALASDAEAAGSFARVIVSALDPARRSTPSELLSTPEAPFTGGLVGQRERLADLFLRDESRTYGLLIEAKLGASCSWKQIPDYLRMRPSRLGLREDANVEVVVLAARSLALPASRARARWLGCATWQEVVDDLEGIEFADQERALRWHQLLARYRHARGFGTPRRVHLPPASTLDSSVVQIVAAATTASMGSLRVRAVPWNPKSQAVVRKRPTGASMCIQIVKPGHHSAYADIHLDHPAGAKGSVRIVRWRGKQAEELTCFVVPKNAVRARDSVASEIARLIRDAYLP